MRRLFILLWMPLVIELVNVLVHQTLRGESESIIWLDIMSQAITAAVIFFAGWTVARNLNRLGLAVLGAVLIWVCAVILIVLLMGVEFVLQAAPSKPSDFMAAKGFLLSALLAIPVVVAASAVGAIVARWTRPSGGSSK